MNFCIKLCGSGISVGPWPWGQLQLFESERSLLFPPFFLLFFFRSILSFFRPSIQWLCKCGQKKTSKKAAQCSKTFFFFLILFCVFLHTTLYKMIWKTPWIFKVSNYFPSLYPMIVQMQMRQKKNLKKATQWSKTFFFLILFCVFLNTTLYKMIWKTPWIFQGFEYLSTLQRRVCV